MEVEVEVVTVDKIVVESVDKCSSVRREGRSGRGYRRGCCERSGGVCGRWVAGINVVIVANSRQLQKTTSAQKRLPYRDVAFARPPYPPMPRLEYEQIA